jgi:very-short-patch-repair endonuclease
MADGGVTVTIRDRLLKERNALLDLSTRNRLLNTPLRTRNNRAIEVVDEKAGEVFGLLTSNKAFTFLPGVQLSEADRALLDPEDDITGGVPQPGDDLVDDRGVAARHSDTRLQTRLTSEGLQKRLFDIWYDAQTLEQEQGVNILYLAFGLLRWFDNNTSEIARHAPLVLLPVKLERSSAADKFKLRWREEPPSPNLTLQAKMSAEFALAIEDFKDEEEVDLAAYCAKIAETVSKQKRWEVLPDSMVLGFFSFAKFLMYRDLDPDTWPKEGAIDSRDMIGALLRDGFPESSQLIPDDAAIDDVIPPVESHHVVDADSSQTVAIAEAAGGRSLVVKGPPGTGKSQTITNIIAAAASRGKKVLFVSEKMAALDVVHRRLRQVGLGPLTLELHSNKISKRAVLEELKRTRDGQLRPSRSDLSVIQKLGEASGLLNAFARRLHGTLEPSGLSPQAILGLLAQSQQSSAPKGYGLAGAEGWDRAGVKTRRLVVDEVAERLRVLGPIPQNIWRGVRCSALDPVEREALSQRIAALADSQRQAEGCARVATEVLGATEPRTIGDLHASLAFLESMPVPAELDRTALTSPVWTNRSLDDLRRLLEAGRRHVAAQAVAEANFNESGRCADYAAIRAAVVTKGRSLFRLLDGNYRAQIALLRSYLTAPLPRAQAARIALVDSMLEAQAAATAFQAARPDGAAFGRTWQDEKSDWDQLDSILAWRARHAALPPQAWTSLASVPDLTTIETARTGLTGALRDIEARFAELAKELDLDLRRAFGETNPKTVALGSLSMRLAAWLDDLEGLSRFATFASRTRMLADFGLGSLVDAVHDGVLDPKTLAPAFIRAYAEVLRVVLFSAWPELRSFDGEQHNNLVSLFRQLDKARIGLAQEQIVATHANDRPRGAAGIGPLGVVNAEIARKRGHLPIRVLLERAGPAVQQLKPVFMMSPLSVAQFLKPGGIQFDLLVMDEASQIEPVDALGAIARVNQIVVVGDERQLPPTAFFKKLTGEDETDEADDGITIQAKDAESILELCLAKGVPSRMLNWHYRSKHQSLIAVSNREFYENKLFIVPSPYDAVAGMGLKFNHLKDTAYDRGGTRTNPKEAKAVAEAVIRHARTNPDQSLGVATFSVVQRQAILKELELLRRTNPDLEGFFVGESNEPFFVKNLENIQGDERDVIFISVGYGKTEEGYLAHAFGPLSGEGGERRLNVLISRAKLRCEVFSNFTGADVDLERSRARGVSALKLFLTFAETGTFGLGEVTGADFDSEFEIQVCERLQAAGYEMRRQIGASGFRVDLAVCDSDRPGRFGLGIECDGAQFHSSRSARDRDRLRQQVLEGHGWIIHRIWSADWFLRPQNELKKIEAAIAAARAEWKARDEEGLSAARVTPPSFAVVSNDDPHTTDVATGAAIPPESTSSPYVEASFAVNTALEPHETPRAEMAAHVVRIVEAEGPIHQDEITARIRILWGLGRAGSRIRAAVERATSIAAQRGLIEGGPFYAVPNQTLIVRDRSAVGSATLRRPEMLPPAEIDKSLLDIVDANFGAGADDLVQASARAFGYLSTSSQLRAILSAGVERLKANGSLAERAGMLVRPK